MTGEGVRAKTFQRSYESSLQARGEPFLWGFGGALSLGVTLVLGFLVLVLWNGVTTFWPQPVEMVKLDDGTVMAGEPSRTELYRVPAATLRELPEAKRLLIEAEDGFARRTLYRTGNYDLYNEDFRWVEEFRVVETSRPQSLVFVERQEWGPFIGRVASLDVAGEILTGDEVSSARFASEQQAARARFKEIRRIERSDIGEINHEMERMRLKLRRAMIDEGGETPKVAQLRAEIEAKMQPLKARFAELAESAAQIKEADAKVRIRLTDIQGREKEMPLSQVVRRYEANDIGPAGQLAVYAARWWEFLSEEPREANTEGGILPAIFGTFAMTLLMVLLVTPFGVVTALYLREYAKQGRLVSIVRISVNNLAGVPSIVYGVFGLGFFAYILGGGIDSLFFPERLPNPTFGTGGLLWSSLTLALLTVPVVIVATEEALAAVPKSMREGSLACGASKWQTIRNIVLPRAMPGIMTGIILAMARGAGEVAPLMLVGVVKLAPELPIDGVFPYIHLERSFMHLGFHIFDVGFQSRNSEAGKPMVFVTTLLLIAMIAIMNATAVIVRNRLKRKFMVGHF